MSFLQEEDGRILANQLFNIGAVKFGEFRLKRHETHPDAPLSPIYFNIRTQDNPKPGPLDSWALKMIAQGFRTLVEKRELRFDAISGIPNAGVPLVMAYVHSHTCRTIRLRKDEREEARRISETYIQDLPPFESRVLLVDDVITGADTKLEAIDVLRTVGMIVEDLLVVIDRQQGGVNQVRNVGVRTHSLFDARTLILHYLTRGFIDQATYDRTLAYFQSEAHPDALVAPI